MKKYLHSEFDFVKLADVYDEVSVWSAPFGQKLLDIVEYKPNISAIDIGFGTGFPLTELAMRLGESCMVYGIDPWKEGIIRANRKISYFRITNIKIIEGYAESIPLENACLDLIVSNNGLNNVNDLNKVLSECSRIIRDGGQFVQTMNLDKSMYEFYEQFESVLAELGMQEEINKMHLHIYQKRKPLDEIISLTEKHGFTIRNLEHDRFSYKFTDGTAMFNHYFIQVAFMDSWIKILPKEKTELVFDMIESRLNKQAHQLGGIHLSIPYVMINARKEK